jgi:transketolase
MAYVLFSRFVHHDPQDPRWINRDRFVLSGGHGSAMLYSMLHLTGHAITIDDLKHFRQWDSKTPGHPEYMIERGIETTTGPLGQGISQAVGMALGEAITEERLNETGKDKVIDHYVYVIASDGDLMEGISHEACSFAGAQKLGKLIVLYDDNGICIDGRVEATCVDNAPGRFAAYGWDAHVCDGHNMDAIEAAILKAKEATDKPSIICCKTKIGFGSPGEGSHKVHGAPLGVEGVAKTKAALGLDSSKSFHVDDDVRQRFAEITESNGKRRKIWDDLVQKYICSHPDRATFIRALRTGALPSGWEQAIPSFASGAKIATRVASGKVIEALSAPKGSTELLSQLLIGGSADLTPSNNTLAAGVKDILPPAHRGGYVHYGVREHAMGHAMNGLALYGYRPFGGTFLIFSDYMRPAVRAAAMIGLPVIFVWTHDSIGLGEDGPTHQPIEHCTSLRAMPNLIVFRPCDANEVAGAWKYSLEQQRSRKEWACEGAHNDPAVGMRFSPCALLLTRQGLSVLSPPANEGKVNKGAYVIRDCEEKPDVILMATGSEVEISCAAKEMLAKDGIAARVVSMPSWELFDRQSQEYRDSVLIPGIRRVAVEAGSSLAWPRYFGGMEGACVSMERYGASAPYATLFKEFNFTPGYVAQVAKKLLGKLEEK